MLWLQSASGLELVDAVYIGVDRSGDDVGVGSEAVVEMYPDVFTNTPIYGGVQALSASSVDLRIVAKVDETQLYRAQRLLNRELKLALDAGRHLLDE